MILAQIVNTPYNSVNLNRLLPLEREFLRVEEFSSLEELVKNCNPRERYVFIREETQLDPGQIELLANEACLHPYHIVSWENSETFFEDKVFSLTGNAIKECEGHWERLHDLGYPLTKIIEENKNAKNNNVKGTSCKF